MERRTMIPSVALPVLLIAVMISCCCLPHAASSRAFPVCAGSRAPELLAETLGFCGYSGISCCNADDDASLREEFKDMNVSSDAGCTAIVKDTLCERCIPSRSVHEPFNAAGSTTAKSIPPRCVRRPSSSSAGSRHQDTMCLERIGVGFYLNMAAHPDGSARVFLSTRDGKIWLASVPKRGSGSTLQVDDGVRPFLDLTDRVHYDEVLGLMGVAFHPGFATNGRFFVSYNCDSTASPTCISLAATGNRSSRPCQYQLIVAEFSAKYKAARADPSEVRRIFTMGLPQPHTSYSYQQHGGQILFRPSDGHLYLMTGHGGQARGQLDSSKNKSFLGKIIRFNVDRVPGPNGQTSSRGDRSATPTMEKPEIFATGLSNPRGCSFDSERPSYFYCADVGEQEQEEVHLISRPGGNYRDSSVNTASLIVGHGRPAAGSRPSIVGGLVYRGSADPSLKGRYLFMYGFAAWAAVEAPKSSGHYASFRIPNIKCSVSTPIPCRAGGIGGRVLSFGQDNSKDAFVLATGGVYRVVGAGLCGGAYSTLSQAQQSTPDYTLLLVFGPFVLFLLYWFYQTCMKLLATSNGQTATHHCECCGCCGFNTCCGNVFCCSHVTHNY